MIQYKKVELLSPAGNKEGFFGAIHAGADAVYLGGTRFGARAYADNFTTEELIDCIQYAHLFGRRVYLTVNTLVKEKEFQELYDYLLPFYKAELDGVIVQDIGVFGFIRRHFPNLELHISTQMTITGVYGAKLLKEMGACRIVPARELSLKEIIYLKQETGLEIETFIHGAMCYCYSGQCLFSSILGGRSGNRGRCAQPCRLPYQVQEGQKISSECYPLSLKDMCTIEHIPDLIEAGIDSFKIEGRMKKPEYTAGVTAIYRKYIDKYYQGLSCKVSEEDLRQLSCLYIRSERQNGYYYRQNGKDMVTLSSPAYSGSDEKLLSDIRRKYLENDYRLPIIIYASFEVGYPASLTLVREEISITVTGEMVSEALKQPITAENIEKQLGKLGDTIFYAENIQVQVSDNAFYPLKAINELRRKAVSELKNEILKENKNSSKRKVSEKILTKDKSIQKEQDFSIKPQKNITRDSKFCVSVTTEEQLSAITEGPQTPERIYINGDLLLEHRISNPTLSIQDNKIFQISIENNKIFQICEKLSFCCEVILSFPYILRQKEETFLQNLLEIAQVQNKVFRGIQVRSLEGLGFLKEKQYKGNIYLDAGVYTWNKETLNQWQQEFFAKNNLQFSSFCLPFELKAVEQKELLTASCEKTCKCWNFQEVEQKELLTASCEKVVYGRIPMMITANCVMQTMNGCKNGKAGKEIYLIDRYQKKFPVLQNCIHCYNVIYNSVPLSLHAELSRWQKHADFRLDFTVEGKEETLRILHFFYSLKTNGVSNQKLPYYEYTTGHEKRGVE